METLYLKIDQNIEVHQPDITLADVASMTCADDTVVNRLKTVKIVKIRKPQFTRYIVSVLAIIEKIHEVYPQLEVNNIGEMDFVLTYRPQKNNIFFEVCKTAIVFLIMFFGSAFTIMTFNNDVGVPQVFDKLYKEMLGKGVKDFNILEIAYSVGIGIGILVFFNHFFGRRITTDPTPIEVQMRLYEENVNKTLIESCTRKESEIDVD